MKKTATLAAVALALVLTACGPTDSAPSVDEPGMNGIVRAAPVTLPDGQEVLCVTWKYGYAGGLSCDWDNSR